MPVLKKAATREQKENRIIRLRAKAARVESTSLLAGMRAANAAILAANALAKSEKQSQIFARSEEFLRTTLAEIDQATEELSQVPEIVPELVVPVKDGEAADNTDSSSSDDSDSASDSESVAETEDKDEKDAEAEDKDEKDA